MNKVVTIVGGGSSAHILVPLLSLSGHKVNLLTSRPREWATKVEAHVQGLNGKVTDTLRGELSLASDKPEAVVPSADVIVLCMPVSKYRVALHHIAQYIKNRSDVFVGALYGQAGLNWMIDEIRGQFQLSKITAFAAGLLPWICRTAAYGRVGVTYGSKVVNVAAVSSPDTFAYLDDVFLKNVCARWFGQGQFVQAKNFLSLTLSVDNQIIHPSRCYGLFLTCGAQWKQKEDIPYFYRDFDKRSADILEKLDADYTTIRQAIIRRYPREDFRYMLDYLALERLSYHSANTDICESFRKSSTLGSIKPPTVQNEAGAWVIDRNHRFFTDDIYYGLCIAKWIANRLALQVPTIDGILDWAQEMLNERIINGSRLLLDGGTNADRFKHGMPSAYGYDSLDHIMG